ncbi:hypothetical protein C0993_006251, partial [Termitomyces sp. T159_Od127]
RTALGVKCEFNGVDQLAQLDRHNVECRHIDFWIHTVQQLEFSQHIDYSHECVVDELAHERETKVDDGL